MNSEDNSVPPKEQCEIIKKLFVDLKVKEGDTVYLISKTWWHNWKKYVGYCKPNDGTKDLNPGEIDNNRISCDNKRSYIIVNTEIWDKLFEWYGGGPKHALTMINTGKELKPNTDPLVLTVIYQGKEKELTTNKEVIVSQFKKVIYKEFGIHSKTETKLADYWQGNFLKYCNDNASLSSNQIYSKQQIVLCKKHKNGKFKYDKDKTSYNYGYSYSYNNAGPAPAPGVVGLNNLGNTCYFNSGTQCLLHSRPLMHIFLDTNWKEDLNRTNPIGMKGELAEAFADLMKKVWSNEAKQYYSPSELKSVMGKNIHQFSGYEQQDSQELITFMLDGLHEDLNKCREKPQLDSINGDGTDDEKVSVDSWNNFKKRNDSVIVDNFYGQFRSTLDCPNCNRKTVIFDEFNLIPLPISTPKLSTKNLVFIPADFREKHQKITISISEDASAEKISEEVSKAVGRSVSVVVASQTANSVNWGIKEKSSYYTPTFYAFEVPEEDKDKFLIPCKIQLEVKYSSYYSSNFTRAEDAAGPILVPVSSKDAPIDEIVDRATKMLECLWEPCEIPVPDKCKEILDLKVDKISSDDDDQEDDDEEKADEDKKDDEKTDEEKTDEDKKDEDKKDDEKTDEEKTDEEKKDEEKKDEDNKSSDSSDSDDDNDNDSKKKVNKANKAKKTGGKKANRRFLAKMPKQYNYQTYRWDEGILADKENPNCSANLIDLKLRPKFLNDEYRFSPNSLFRHFDEDNENQSNDCETSESIDLDQCFKFFSTQDILDENNQWFCPRCREFVCAKKQNHIWKVPECLILQLKRFISNEYTTRKDETLVRFPETLDLSNYIVGPQKNEENLKYKLYAVSEHSGFLGGGHYTAHAKVVQKGHVHGNWYYFNDSSVSQSSFEDTQAPEAYVLFYQKYDPNLKSDDDEEAAEKQTEEEEEKKDENSSDYCDSEPDDESAEDDEEELKLSPPSSSASSSDDEDEDNNNTVAGNVYQFGNNSYTSNITRAYDFNRGYINFGHGISDSFDRNTNSIGDNDDDANQRYPYTVTIPATMSNSPDDENSPTNDDSSSSDN